METVKKIEERYKLDWRNGVRCCAIVFLWKYAFLNTYTECVYICTVPVQDGGVCFLCFEFGVFLQHKSHLRGLDFRSGVELKAFEFSGVGGW